MRVVRPVAINAATLTASNVAENDAPAWASGGSYSAGQQVLDNHHVFEWLGSAAGNTTVRPSEDMSVPVKWLDTGADNRYRMFDKQAGTKWLIGRKTTNPELIDVTIQSGQVVNSVGLIGVSGASVTVTMESPGEGIVYDRTVQMADTGVMSWYDYFFAPFDRRDNLALFDLPAYGNASVRVQISAPGGTAATGMLIIGSAVNIGDAVYGTGVGLDNYTNTTEDEFGNVTITPRGSRRVVEFDVRIPTNEHGSVLRTLERLKDTAALYVGDPDKDSTITVGRYERLRIIISNPATCESSLEVRSLA